MIKPASSSRIEAGQSVVFRIDDRLLGSFEATGTIYSHVFGDLWRISPDPHGRLSGSCVTIHSDFIFPKNSQKTGLGEG